MSSMLLTFGQAVEALRQAGVRFVCVKGFSLIPEYLTELWQRHQIDFDLLVAPDDALRAQQALEKLGYRLTAIDGAERRLRIPVSRPLALDAYLYNPQEGGAIELHSGFWEAGAEAHPLRCPSDAFEQAEMHTVGSVSFLRLARRHAFLYQVLHVFRHFLGLWARRSGSTRSPHICTGIGTTMRIGGRCGRSFARMRVWRKLPRWCLCARGIYLPVLSRRR